MKKIIAALFLFAGSNLTFAQQSKLSLYADELQFDQQQQPNYLRLKENYRIPEKDVTDFINALIFSSGKNTVKSIKTENDFLGYTHIRYQVYTDNIPVAGKIIIAHLYRGQLQSLNGDLYNLESPANSFVLDEASALKFALGKVNAEKYKWDNKAEEAHMREALEQPDFTYYPHGVKSVYDKNGKLFYAYSFNIYAEVPLYRANVFVNAQTGEILEEQNLICHADVPGTAVTKYSGTQTITCDQNGTQYRLKETGRGLGIETYNLATATMYANNNFTNASTTWSNTNIDQAATDAHWGAEKTYDYYMNQHNRNSINNAGFKLLSYVHYGVNYQNAFWDGQRMTYGDGNGTSYKIFTALDVCGHEITHGLTSNTGNLNYSNESGALNESFSDIFGTCIENFARPGNWNWRIGEDLTSSGNGLRSMSNPNGYGDPDTYGGSNYYTGTADNGGVHTNSGVSNFWFYLLTTGGSGVNDLANSYSVAPLGFTSASRIAFRALTVYFTPSTNFATARALTIQAAKDLFGNCSNEVFQTMNAWHAVGIGNKYVPGLIAPNFTSSVVNFCTLPATVNFNNTTASGVTYSWNFGDGAVATTTNAVHTYTANGTYSVKLKAVGCTSADSITKPSFVIINVPAAPVASNYTGCANSSNTLTATGSSVLKWFDSPTGQVLGSGSTFVTSPTNSATTYYVANTVPSTPTNGGLMNNTNGGYLANSAQWLVFDVVQTCTLNSVVVFANSAGTRTIELRNSSNVTINSFPITLTTGSTVVNLNFPLTIGTNYRLALGAGTSNLYRTNNGVTYPYNVGGCVNIVNSSAGPGAYYWYYNWEVLKEDCTSPLVPVNITLNPSPSVNLTASSDVVCKDDEVVLTGAPAGGSYAGAGVTNNLFSSSNVGTGVQTVYYSVVSSNGCVGTASKSLNVNECTGINSLIDNINLSVYPNPVKDKLSFSGVTSNSSVSLTDVAGRSVLQSEINSDDQSLDVSGVANGLYLLSVTQNGKVLLTVKVVKE